MANTSPTTPTLSSQKLRFERTGTGPISTNLGSGAQTNSTQTGGRNNRMFYVRDYHEHRSDHDDTTPPPSHNLPFLRDDEFVERLELTTLQQKLQNAGKRVALSGIGGVGKSQLALEYCYQQRQEKPDVWVLWIHAGSAARYDEDMRSLAERLKIPGRDNPQVNIHQLVSAFLGDERNAKWLLVVDNVDEIETLANLPKDGVSASAKSRLEYLPVCDHGSILFTTRRRTVAAKLVNDRDIIDILPNERHAEEMLKVKLGQSSNDDINKRLATALEYMPLAIAQSIAYIRHSQPKCTTQEYLTMLGRGDDKKAQLLSEVAEEVRRDFREASNSIILSWQISFEHIRARRKSAADLLSLMSFYNHQGIPRFILEDPDVKKPPEESSGSRFKVAVKEFFTFRSKHADRYTDSIAYEPLLSQTTLDGDIKVLKDYSFISSKSHKHTFEMHRLVQLAAQVWLKTEHNFDLWQSESIYRLSADFPESEHDQWTERKKCHALFLQAKLALDWQPVDRDTQLEFARLMHMSSGFAEVHGMDKQAEIMCRRALQIYSDLLAVDHVQILSVNNTLTLLLREQGHFDLAEQNCRRALKQAEKLSKKHIEILQSYRLLGDIYLDRGDYITGEKMYKRVLKYRRKVLGDEHPDTLWSLGDLAEALRLQGRFSEAEDMNREALKLQQEVLKPGDPDILKSMHSLALLLHDSGKREESRVMHKELLATYRENFGESHPKTLAGLHNYALQLQANEEYEEAEKLMHRAWTESCQCYSDEHPDSLQSMHTLACLYSDMGRYDEAIDLMRRCLEIRRKVLREYHPDTNSSEVWLQHLCETRERLVKDNGGKPISAEQWLQHFN